MTLPFRRRAHSFNSPHDRARIRAAERLDGPLDSDESAWLDNHLAGCRACQAIVDTYESNRLELRSLGRQELDPPRDLWARTAAAIEREAASRTLTPTQPRRPLLPIGAMSGLLVVAVVVGASVLSGRDAVVPPSPTSPLLAASDAPPTVRITAEPFATPLLVAADAAWLTKGSNGKLEVNRTTVSEVCPDESPDCATLEAPTPGTIEIDDTPKAVILSPGDDHLVVLSDTRTGGDGSVQVVPVPDGSATPSPEPSPLGSPASESPVVESPPPATLPTVSPDATASMSPSTTTEPSASTDPTASVEPTSSPEPSPSDPDSTMLIAEGLVVVGATAAFSEDGSAFAFTGRPVDGAHGPDVYVWTVGDQTAQPVTDDHRSVFAGWRDDLILASRIVEGAAPDASADPSGPASGASARPDAPVEYLAETFLLDTASGDEAVFDQVAVWRPSVDPTGTRAVYWQGTLRQASNNADWRTSSGRLVVGAWPEAPAVEPAAEPVASGAPDASAEPSASVAPSSPELPLLGSVEVLVDGPVRDWDARWNEDGTHLAVWIADPDDPRRGRLSLYILDPETGRIDADNAPLKDQFAMPGFAIGENRLVWATPPGQDGKGSHVELLAWTEEGIGQVESAPGDELVVVVQQ